MAMSNRMTKIFFVIAVGALCFIYGFCTYGRTWQLEADHPLSHQNDFARQLAWRRKLTPSDNPGKIIRGRFIVVFNDAMLDDDDDVDALAEYVANVTGADVLWTYTEVIKGVAIEGVVSQSSLDAILQRDDIERIEQDHTVEFDDDEQQDAGNSTMHHRDLQSGGQLPHGLDRIDQVKLPLDGKYRYRYNGSGVTVYILDSGTRQSHVDFQGQWTECGFDAYRKRTDADRCMDYVSHGTHVTATIGGRISGVAKNAKLVTVRVMNSMGEGSDAAIIAGLNYVIRQKKDNPSVPMVVNLSLGGLTTLSFNRAVNKVVDAGIVVVAAAGNSGVSACLFSPASSRKVITVGASSYSRVLKRDRRSIRSNNGRCVDLFAPGSDILSAVPDNDWAYTTKSGTSMAAAHVSGAAALYLQRDPNMTPNQVRDALVSDASVGQLQLTFDLLSPNKLLYTGGIGMKKQPKRRWPRLQLSI